MAINFCETIEELSEEIQQHLEEVGLLAKPEEVKIERLNCVVEDLKRLIKFLQAADIRARELGA